MFLMALFVFQVPLKGSFPDFVARRADLCHAMTAYGMLISGSPARRSRRCSAPPS
jgi:hypothetical protein